MCIVLCVLFEYCIGMSFYFDLVTIVFDTLFYSSLLYIQMQGFRPSLQLLRASCGLFSVQNILIAQEREKVP